MVMPNFLIIGAPKSGTTTLHYVLDQHPEIYMSAVKEPGFFWAYGEPVDLRGPSALLLKHRAISDLDAYQRLFAGVTTERAIGESSARYLFQPRSPALIYEFIPHARLVVSLRNPAERAFSSFSQYLRDGVDPCPDFAQAVAHERQGLRAEWTFGRHLESGFYYAAIQRYLVFFSRQQLHISLFEDLKDDPLGLVRSLCEFLEVDGGFEPDMSHRHNVSGVIRNPVLRWIWTRTNRLRAAVRPLVGLRLRHLVSEWFYRDVEKPDFPPELRAELTEYYRQDIEQLQGLIQRDLSHWLEPVE